MGAITAKNKKVFIKESGDIFPAREDGLINAARYIDHWDDTYVDYRGLYVIVGSDDNTIVIEQYQ